MGVPGATLEVAEAFELMDRKEGAAKVLELCDITRVAREKLPVAKKLVQVYDDLGGEKKARRARDALEALWEDLHRRRIRRME